MKRYSISYMRVVNRKASKTGLSFSYEGRTDNPQEAIDWFESHPLEVSKSVYKSVQPDGSYKYYDNIHAYYIGIRIVDSKTKEVVYQSQRVNDADELIERLKGGD